MIAVGLGIYIVCKRNSEFKSIPTQEGLPALEVVVVFANPVSPLSRYRVGIVRNTNIDDIKTTPLQYCRYAYSRLCTSQLTPVTSYTLALGLIGRQGVFATIFRLSTRGSKLRMDLGLGRWIYMVLRQHSRIDLDLCCSISLHLKRSMHGRLLKRGAGPFSAL